MGNNQSQARVVVKAKGRGPIPPAILNLQNPEYLNSSMAGGPVVTGTYAPSMVPTVPIAAAAPLVAPPAMATVTTTDTVISGPMLPPRLPPVPVIEHPIQPGIYGATAVGPSVAETFVIQHAPFVANGPAVIDETIINASAPMQPGISPLPSPQPSPQASLQQAQLLQLQQQQLLQQQEEAYFQQTQFQGRVTPPLPAGYDQTEFYSGTAAYALNENEASDDDTASYSSFEEEVFTSAAPPALGTRSYRRESPQPIFARGSPQPTILRDSPPLPLSARRRAAYATADTPYEPYSRSRAFDRYQARVNSRMGAYDQRPDQYGFYPNAYRI